MTPDSRGLVLRRTLLTVGVVTTATAGAAFVRLASDISSAAAQADVATGTVQPLQAQMDQTAARVSSVAGDTIAISEQVRTLFESVTTSTISTGAQTAAAQGVANDLAASKAHLATIQAQLSAADKRLTALDAAAARIAASKTVVTRTVTATTGASGAAAGSDN